MLDGDVLVGTGARYLDGKVHGEGGGVNWFEPDREFLNKLSKASSSGPAGSERPSFARAMTSCMTSRERKLGREVEAPRRFPVDTCPLA